jgi:ubiquinone/menaquinone biosynthesis C-methylase UbiE
MSTSESLHEAKYRELQASGFEGWGAERLPARMLGWQATVDRLIQSGIFPEPGSKLLELGCGAGDSLLPFAERGFEVTGVDFSETAIRWAREKFAGRRLPARFLERDVVDLEGLVAGEFEAVIDGACLHCVVDETSRQRSLREALRVLRPGGFFLVSHMIDVPRELPANVHYDPGIRAQIHQGIPYRYMPSLEQLRDELEAWGCEILREDIRRNPWWDHGELWCRKHETGK